MKTILTIIGLILLVNFILRSKLFRVWRKSRNKTENQKRAIKFLIYGPSRSQMSKEDYDQLCNEMYPNSALLERAKSKFKISDSDIVTHPCKEIDTTYLSVRNYMKDGEDILFCDVDTNQFRSSKMDCFLVIFGKKKLYFYRISYRTDKTEETENTYEFSYDEIQEFRVNKIAIWSDNNINTEFVLHKERSEEDKGNKQNTCIRFPRMAMDKAAFKRWEAVGTHLDSPNLKKEYKDKSEDEKKAIRYFKAYFNLPLAITDREYEALIDQTLPAEELKTTGMNNMGIEDADIQLAAPIAFRSYVYGQDTLEIKGIDGAWRSSAPQHTWLFFGRHQIYVYLESILMDCSIKQQSTQEIFYRDITSIRTEQLSTEKVEGDVTYRISYFKFTILFSGDSLSLTLPILTDENDKKIRAMRNLLRETKQTDASNNSGKEDFL